MSIRRNAQDMPAGAFANKEWGEPRNSYFTTLTEARLTVKAAGSSPAAECPALCFTPQRKNAPKGIYCFCASDGTRTRSLSRDRGVL